VSALPVKIHIAGTDKKCDMSWRRQDKISDDGFSSERVKTKNYCGILQLPSYRHFSCAASCGLWLASQMYINQVTSLSLNSYAVPVGRTGFQ